MDFVLLVINDKKTQEQRGKPWTITGKHIIFFAAMFGVKKLAAKKQVGHFFRLIAALDYPGLLSVWFRLRAALK